MQYPHQPVLVHEAVATLVHDPAGTYVDGTAGTGGHSIHIAERLRDQGRLICLDRDPDAVRLTGRRLARFKERVSVIQGNFAALGTILEKLGVTQVDGILLDLGMSTLQLENSGRGFSFRRDEPLDMRMDPAGRTAAEDLVNRLSQRELEHLLRTFGEERWARSIARAIVSARARSPINRASQLAAIVQAAVPPSHRIAGKHPATRSFQALRIAVNEELESLRVFLAEAAFQLRPDGRLVALSYHSLEDRLIKRAMQGWERPCTCPPDLPRCQCGNVPVMRRLNRRGIKPGQEELSVNPRARSATLRAAERIGS